MTGVRHHPPGRTDKNICRCFVITDQRARLSPCFKDVTRAKAVVEIEIFEGNLASLREDEMEGLSSADEESD